MIGDESTNWTRHWPTDVHQEPNYLRAHTWDDHSDRALLALFTSCNYKGGKMNATYGLNETDCQLISVVRWLLIVLQQRDHQRASRT